MTTALEALAHVTPPQMEGQVYNACRVLKRLLRSRPVYVRTECMIDHHCQNTAAGATVTCGRWNVSFGADASVVQLTGQCVSWSFNIFWF